MSNLGLTDPRVLTYHRHMTNTDPNPNPGRVPQFTLGDRLRKARESRGLDMQALGELIDIHRQSVARYEQDVAVPKRHVLLSWSVATGVALEWITGTDASTHVEQTSRSTDSVSKGFPRFKTRGIPRESSLITTGK